MTRDESLDPIIQPWMERNAPAAPQDLLPRVMREVDTVSQRSSTWPRLFFSAHPAAWMVATAAAAILAVSVGAFLVSSGTRPMGGGATPAPATPATAAEVIDASIDAFNARDSVAAGRLFTQDATYRAAIGWAFWNMEVTGLDAIKQMYATHTEPDLVVRHGSVLENGPYAATPIAWTYTGQAVPGAGSGTVAGSGFTVSLLDGSRLSAQWTFTLDGIPDAEPFAAQPADATDSLVSRLIAMWNARDASAVPALFAVNGQARFAIGSATWTAEYDSPQAIASALTDVGTAPGTLTRTGAIITYGQMAGFAATLTSGDHTAKVFVLLQLSADDSLVKNQWVIGG